MYTMPTVLILFAFFSVRGMFWKFARIGECTPQTHVIISDGTIPTFILIPIPVNITFLLVSV